MGGDSLYPSPWEENSAVFTPLGIKERADLAASAAPKVDSPEGKKLDQYWRKKVMTNHNNQKTNETVTLYCDIGAPSCNHLIDRFQQNDFPLSCIDSGREIPVAEFKGQYHTGTRQIIMHFFPHKKN